MSRPPGPIVKGIIRVLEENGPMTRVQIARALGMPRDLISPVVTRMLKAGPQSPRRLHIADHQHEEEGKWGNHVRAVIALGDKPDAPRPERMTAAEVERRYRENRKTRVSSVWEFAMSRRARAAARQPK